jgi:hypothetical protein
MTISPNNLVWLEVAARIKADIETARTDLERTQPEAESAFTRGRIAYARSLLNMNDPVKKPAFPESPSY